MLYSKFYPYLLAAALVLPMAGCGESANVDLMKQGLTRNGLPADQAICYAENLDGKIKGEIYNFIAALMNEGITEKDSINRARRKFGADFKTPLEEVRNSCVN